MRFSTIITFLGASALVRAKSADDKNEPTVFNGVEVPPLLELTPDTYEKELKANTFLIVKHYSPYCHHCLAFAPTYQTAYEFYYTSKPEGTDKSFSEFYDFKWATVNCVAYYDLCSDHQVTSYPTTTLFKDGEIFDTLRGGKNMTMLSTMIEGGLEKAKPDSRPKFIALPTEGDKGAPKASLKSELPEKAAAEAAAAAPPAAPPAAPAADEDTKKSPALPADEAEVDTKSAIVEEKAATVAPAAPTKPKSTATPNENGISVPLTAESFQTLVTMTQEPWFVKFYAPWCHHCQAMAPNWEQLAKDMKGRLNIGEVNCDKESRLCKEAGVRGYPTIHFFRGGERVEYDGLRGLGDFVHYAEKAIDLAGGVQDVDLASFEKLEEKEEVIFIYFYDHATTSEDFMALERLPLSLIGHAKLVKTKDPKMYERYKITTWPRFLVSREGRPTYYTPLTPREMRDVHGILNWMKSVWLPIVPELSASNAREIMDGKIVVLGILNREDQEAFLGARREMKSAANEWMDKQIQLLQLERQELRDAKQLRIEEAEDRGDQRALRQAKAIRINMDKSDRKEVAFAWVDGTFWQRWIRTTYGIDSKDGDRVIINDEDNRRYWDTTVTGNNIVPSRTSIMETITKVTAQPPKIKPKLTISSFEKVFFDIRVTFAEHPWFSMAGVLAVAFVAISWFRGRLRRTRPNFRLEDAMGIKELKEGLLGGGVNGNGKVD